MKKILVISALISVVLMVGGCDFFRSLAGRPTSEYISRKKAILELEGIAASQQGSVAEEKIEKTKEDSLEVIRAIAEKPALLVSSSKMSPEVVASLPNYCIMTGAFGNPDNASRLAAKMENAGYKSVLLPYSNGLTAVGVNPTNSIVDAYRVLTSLKEAELCPADAWILDNR